MAGNVKLDFKKFKTAVANQFAVMQGFELFTTMTDKDVLWATYLRSFPQGTNPVFRYNTEHNCNACKAFIGEVGNVVAVREGELISLWDIQIDEPAYKVVADALSAYVKSRPLGNRFVLPEGNIGVDKNSEQVASVTVAGKIDTVEWDHFFINPSAVNAPTGPGISNGVGHDDNSHECYIRIVTPNQLPGGVIGDEYSIKLEIEHCGDKNHPIWFSRGNYPYPDGISLRDGILSGRPTTAGTFTFDINASVGGAGYTHNAYTDSTFVLTVTSEAVMLEDEQDYDVVDTSHERKLLITQLLRILQLRRNELLRQPVAETPPAPTVEIPLTPDVAEPLPGGNVDLSENENNSPDGMINGQSGVIEENNGYDEGGHIVDINNIDNLNGVDNPGRQHECYIDIVTSNYLPNTEVGSEYRVRLEVEHCGDDSCIIDFNSPDHILPDWVHLNEDGMLTCAPTVVGKFSFTIFVTMYSDNQQHYAYTEKTFTINATDPLQGSNTSEQPDNASFGVIQQALDVIHELVGKDKGGGDGKVPSLPVVCFGKVVSGDEETPVVGARITIDGWVEAASEPFNDVLYAVSGRSGNFSIHMPDKYNFRNVVTITVEKGAAIEVFRRNPAALIKAEGDIGTLVLNIDFLRELDTAAGGFMLAKQSTAMTISGGEGDGGFEFSTDASPGMQFTYNLLHRLIEPEIGAFNGTIDYQWESRAVLGIWGIVTNNSLVTKTNGESLTVSVAKNTTIHSLFRCKVTYERFDGVKRVAYSPVIFMSTYSSAVNNYDMKWNDTDTSLVTLLTKPVVIITPGTSVTCKVSASIGAFELSRSRIAEPVNIEEYKDALFSGLDRITRMRSLGMGYVLKMSQSWKPDGFALGTLLYSTVLAPGEQQRLVVRERSESYTVQDTDDSSASIGETYDIDQSDNISHIYNEAVDQYDEAHSKSVVKSSGWSIGGGASGGISGAGASAMLSVSGGYSSSTTRASYDSNQTHSLDTASSAASTFQRLIKGAAERLTQSKRVGIRMATGSESDSVSTRLISNHNHSHSLTMQYWEVVRKHKLETCIDDVSLVVYIPMELIDFGTGEDTFVEMNELHNKGDYASKPAKLLTDRYGTLLRYHDVLRTYLPAEQLAGLSLLRKFSALPRWDMEKISSNDRPTVISIEVTGSFMPYDRVYASLHLKNGRVIEGFQTAYTTQSMPNQSWQLDGQTYGIDTRHKLYRELENGRKNTGNGSFTFRMIVPANVIDDDYEYVEVSHSYDSQFTYNLYQSAEAKAAHSNYKSKIYDSVKDNDNTAYDLAKVEFHKIEAEAVFDPVVVMEPDMLSSFGPPVIQRAQMAKIETVEVTYSYEEVIREAFLKIVSQATKNEAYKMELIEPLMTAMANSSGSVNEKKAAILKAIDDNVFSDEGRMEFKKVVESTPLQEEVKMLIEQPTPEMLASGMLKLDRSLRFPMYDSKPTMRYADLQKIETMKRHVLENGVFYSQAVWASLSADERALLFEKYTIEMPAADETRVNIKGKNDDTTNQQDNEDTTDPINPSGSTEETDEGNGEGPDDGEIVIPSMNETQGTAIPLMNCVINQPLGFYGNCMVLPFVYPPKLAEALGTTSSSLQDALYRYHTQAFRVPTTTISLPTTGMMGDAMLGKNNASEKIDLTRFWNWSDAPIPESDRIGPEYFKSNNLLDNRVAPESSLPEGNVNTMPITASLMDSVAASSVLQSMVAKQAPSFQDLSGYDQLQALSSSESQARTQLAQQTAQTTQKAIETAMQQHNAMQQSEAVQSTISQARKIAENMRNEAATLEASAKEANRKAKEEIDKKHVITETKKELSDVEKAENAERDKDASEYKQKAAEYERLALKLRESAAEVEKAAVTSSMAALSGIYTGTGAKSAATDNKAAAETKPADAKQAETKTTEKKTN